MSGAKYIQVCWHEGSNSSDNRCWLGMTTMLIDAFDATFAENYELIHRNTMAEVVPDDNIIMVIHGDHEHQKVDQIKKELDKFQRALVVVIGDESALFPSQALIAPNRKIWHQVPIPGRHDFATRFLICGYPHDAPRLLSPYIDKPKTLDWAFMGQVTHVRRQMCAEQLRTMKNGYLLETAGFWQGLDRAEYYKTMASAKVIPCPSGPVNPDSFRVWEALEAGCVPIVDGMCPKFAYPNGYWKYVLRYDPPFPIIYDWKSLPEVMEAVLAKWETAQSFTQAWWNIYKKDMKQWVAEDLRSLQC